MRRMERRRGREHDGARRHLLWLHHTACKRYVRKENYKKDSMLCCDGWCSCIVGCGVVLELGIRFRRPTRDVVVVVVCQKELLMKVTVANDLRRSFRPNYSQWT
jgi:hypothetical protein